MKKMWRASSLIILFGVLLALSLFTGTIHGKSGPANRKLPDIFWIKQPRGFINRDTGRPIAKRFRSGQVLVKFKRGDGSNKLMGKMKNYGALTITAVGNTGLSLVTLNSGKDVMATVKQLKKDRSILYAEPNYLRFLSSIPNDPKLPKMWGLGRMSVTKAWDIQGHSPVTVAVLDSGVDKDHEDLKNNLLKGKHFWVDRKGKLQKDNDYSDQDGHGTHVSGIIAATCNNNKGISGIAPYAKILPLKVEGDYWIDDASIAAALKYAADYGAKVVNMSLSGPDRSDVLADGVSYAYSKGCTIVAAAGNSGDLKWREYPAALDHVIAVAATDWSKPGSSSENIAYFSSAGDYVDVSAPGVRILSTYPSQSYIYESGTSMASPEIAGVAALIKSKTPTATPDSIEQILEWTSVDFGDPGKDQFYGYGQVDAYEALKGIGVNDRYEPNDTPTDATLAHKSSPMLSTLTSTFDTDWFIIDNKKSPDKLKAKLEFAGANSANLEIYDQSGSVLQADSDALPESATVVLPSRGFYCAKVEKTGSTIFPCNYKLTVSIEGNTPEISPRAVRPKIEIMGMPSNMVYGQAATGQRIELELIASNGKILEKQSLDALSIFNVFISERFSTSFSPGQKIRMTSSSGGSTEQIIRPLFVKANPVLDSCFGNTSPDTDVDVFVGADNFDSWITKEVRSSSTGGFSLDLHNLADLRVGDYFGASVFDEATGNFQASDCSAPGLTLDLGSGALLSGYLDDKTLDKIHVEIWRSRKLIVRTDLTRSYDLHPWEYMGNEKNGGVPVPVRPVLYSYAFPDGTFYIAYRTGFVCPGDRIYVKCGSSAMPQLSMRVPPATADAIFKSNVVVGRTLPNRRVFVLVKRRQVETDTDEDDEEEDYGSAIAPSRKSFVEEFQDEDEKIAIKKARSKNQGWFVASFSGVFDIKNTDEMRVINFDSGENYVETDYNLADQRISVLKVQPAVFSPLPLPGGIKRRLKIMLHVSKDGMARLAIRNSKGSFVRVINKKVKKGINSISWSGKNGSGITVAPGSYRYSLSVKDRLGNRDMRSGRILVDTKRPSITQFSASPNPFLPYPDGVKDFTLLSFNLSEKCTVGTSIKDSKGEVVREIRSNCSRGMNRLKWTGMNSEGTLAPIGKYKVELTATDVAGNSSQVTLWPVKLYM